MRLSTLIALACTLAACRSTNRPATDTAGTRGAGAAGQPVSLLLDRTEYRSGATVQLTLVNQSDRTYTFNPCPRIVEREDAGAWTRIPEPDRVCTMEAWLLQPHERRNATTDLPASLAAGRYRLVILLAPESGPPSAPGVAATSEPFTVMG